MLFRSKQKNTTLAFDILREEKKRTALWFTAIMQQINDTQDLIKIYTFAKTYLEVQQEKVGVCDKSN